VTHKTDTGPEHRTDTVRFHSTRCTVEHNLSKRKLISIVLTRLRSIASCPGSLVLCYANTGAVSTTGVLGPTSLL
jgi:hypothetical protein